MSRRRFHDSYEDLYGGDRAHKKRRRGNSENNDLEDRLESLILKVGEKTSSTLESNLEGLVSVLDGNLQNFKKKVLKLLVDCAINMPEKCTIYSTLVGLLNAKNYNFGGEFVENIVRTFKDSLKNNSWNEARVILRFIGDLVNCHVVSANSFVQLMASLLDVTKEDGVPNVRKDWYCYAVMSCLPWVGRELYEKRESPLEMLLTTIEVYLNKRPKKHINMLRIWLTDIPHPQEEYLECLWNQIKKLKHDSWTETIIPRPYLTFDNVLCEALQHNLPVITPPPHHNACVYPMPWVVCRLFDYTDVTEGHIMPGAHSIERFLVEEHLQQIIDMSSKNRKECATNLMNFVHKNKVPLEYCIVEVIFSLMFHQPKPKYLEVMFGSVFIELSKLSTNTMPLVLAQTTEILYSRIESMHVCAFDRFVSWFAYHLSNFKFSWSWQEWADCLTLDPEHPKPKFVREVLQKAMRLSFYERMRDIVPVDFEPLLPEKPDTKYKFAIEKSKLPGQFLANTLLTKIRNKATPEEVLEILKEPLLLDNGEIMEPVDTGLTNPIKIDAYVQTLLYIASKSFSHAFAAITKFISVFKALGETDDGQLQILRSTFDLWSANQQMLTVLIDKMLKTQIIECSSVANWIFSREMVPEFTKLYIWEILSLTINKMSRHVDRLTRELNEAREKLRTTAATSNSSDDSDTETEKTDSKPSRQSTTTFGGQVPMEVDENVTEEMVERMEEKLEMAQADQKNLFLIVFQRFIMILSEHLVKCDTDDRPFDTYWYKYTIGRLQQVFLAHHEQVQKYSSTLEGLLFTQDLDIHILEVFHQFLALRS
ncbi:nuclear cap-binding protein subunit 1 isoform X2 [Daktulosphaira vitifoliae]|uniref:nuclear cap-binding protein subunit 1 isoform X1 n=1 Tax=Daktulosphaira vitifoliae TaxID=58002 RepID=UPI0021AA6755|nr:nuclear cap-binding protein subunit 1 isoform X1 [Daktulosphaira vitifoliae]XP_050538612.1 nuclear cap-binding protein subunit 1 isoform X2 [Daktulosphaira vitifoliae]